MAEKKICNMTIEQIGTELMSIKNSMKGLEARTKELVAEAVSRGYAGMDIPTVGGDFVVALSEDTQRQFNMDKAQDVLGAEYVGSVLEAKRKKVKLALSDFGTALDDETKNLICDLVEATVKATVRASRK